MSCHPMLAQTSDVALLDVQDILASLGTQLDANGKPIDHDSENHELGASPAAAVTPASMVGLAPSVSTAFFVHTLDRT